MNYIARGYVSLSEEHHRSRSPALSLRVRANLFFSLLPFSSVPPFFAPSPSPSPLPPPTHLILAARGSRWRIVLVNGHPRMLRREYCTSGSPSGHHRVSVEIPSLSSPPVLPVYLFLFPALSSAISGKKIFFVNRRSQMMFSIVACVTYYHGRTFVYLV